MNDHEKITQMREAAEFIVNGMMSGCIQMSVAAKDAYRELVNQFFDDNREFVSPAQHQMCLSDFEYFLSLLAETADHTDNP